MVDKVKCLTEEFKHLFVKLTEEETEHVEELISEQCESMATEPEYEDEFEYEE